MKQKRQITDNFDLKKTLKSLAQVSLKFKHKGIKLINKNSIEK